MPASSYFNLGHRQAAPPAPFPGVVPSGLLPSPRLLFPPYGPPGDRLQTSFPLHLARCRSPLSAPTYPVPRHVSSPPSTRQKPPSRRQNRIRPAEGPPPATAPFGPERPGPLEQCFPRPPWANRMMRPVPDPPLRKPLIPPPSLPSVRPRGRFFAWLHRPWPWPPSTCGLEPFFSSLPAPLPPRPPARGRKETSPPLPHPHSRPPPASPRRQLAFRILFFKLAKVAPPPAPPRLRGNGASASSSVFRPIAPLLGARPHSVPGWRPPNPA